MARHSLSRSGSLPPPFIVPQGEEPVTPESGSGRSSSHLGRVSVRPQSLPTGDTVSEQSTLYTSDDAGNGYTVAEVTPQSAPCSTVYSNLHGVPAACKELCVPRPQHEQARKRKAAAGDRSNSPTDTLLPDVQQGVPVTEGSMQLKQQKKEQGSSLPATVGVVQSRQDSPFLETDEKNSIPSTEPVATFSPATVAKNAPSGSTASESTVKPAAESAASAIAGSLGASDNAVCGMPIQRRPCKGMVLPNKNNLIAAIREKRARNGELSSAASASTLPPPCKSTSVQPAQQRKGDVPPPPKFTSASSTLAAPKGSNGLITTGTRHRSLGSHSKPSQFNEKLPPVPPSAWPAQHTQMQEGNRVCGALDVATGSNGVRSKFRAAAPPLPTSNPANEQSKCVGSAPPAQPLTGANSVGSQQNPAKSGPSSACKQELGAAPVWGASISTSGAHVQPGVNNMHVSHAPHPAYSSAPSLPPPLPSAHTIGSSHRHAQPPRPPPGSLAFSQAHAWHASPHSSHLQHHMPRPPGQYHCHAHPHQPLYPNGHAYHPGWMSHHPQHFHNPYHHLRPQTAHHPVPPQAPSQPHSMVANSPRPPSAPMFSSQPGTAPPPVRAPSFGLMHHITPQQPPTLPQGQGGAPWAGRGLV